MENKIVEAYNAGKRVRKKTWKDECWVKKHSDIFSVTNDSWFNKKSSWNFDTNPEDWEIYPEDIKSETPKNPILEAYEQSKRIRQKNWEINVWIKKDSFKYAKTYEGVLKIASNFSFMLDPKEWEIWHEDAKGNTATQTDAIQQAIKLLIENNYEVYHIIKTQIVL